MTVRLRLLVVSLIGALAMAGLSISAAEAATVPKVAGLTAAGSNLTTAKLGVRWTKVSNASYQVRWAASTAALGKAKVYPTTRNSALSPTLGNVCATWYAQVRAKKGTRFGAWSSPKGLRFSGLSGVPAAVPSTGTQPSSASVRVGWAKRAGAAGYRVRYSPAPYGNWPGYFPYTATTAASATSLTIRLPAVDEGDRFMGAAYGNPVFGQLETRRCSGSFVKSPFFAAFPKPLPPGSASTGSALRFGAYNVEKFPQSGNTRIAALARIIGQANLDVIALQEANAGTADALRDRLAGAEGEGDWATHGVGQQQVMWRSSKWTSVTTHDLGKAVDQGVNAARTPLPTPGVRLTPAVADAARQDIFVASVHLEDRQRFDSSATNAERKRDAQAAVRSLLASIGAANPTGLPTLAGGDLKGNFGGAGQPITTGYCDESSGTACVGEGQPTFIRAGYFDARGAVLKSGIQYGTVNGGAAPQVASNSGIGGRADYIVAKGFTGTYRYVNVANTSGTKAPSDHNLIYAEYFVPFVS